MLWNGKQITAMGVITQIILPSIISFVVPTWILQSHLKGSFEWATTHEQRQEIKPAAVTRRQRAIIFCTGVGGLCCVPVFHLLTDLPPFMGILLVLGILWTVTEIIYRDKHEHDPLAKRVSMILGKIDITTILFFLGILMAVSALGRINALTTLGAWLNDVTLSFGHIQHYVVTGVIGVLSAIVDNVPLVAASMGMYAIDPAVIDFAQDGVFWQALAYCAGVGGSMLIIGSAAGVVVMGLEGVSFGWYLKNVTWKVFVGYFAGILAYWALHTYVFSA